MFGKNELERMLREREIVVDPIHSKAIQPASIDFHLSRWFRLLQPVGTVIDPRQEVATEVREVPPGRAFHLESGAFVLGSTVERFEFPPHIGGRLEGKSSMGRIGLVIHSTAGFFDPGFCGHATLEISNMTGFRILLWPGMAIGQMSFFRVIGRSNSNPAYRGRYQNQPEIPGEYRAHTDFDSRMLDPYGNGNS